MYFLMNIIMILFICLNMIIPLIYLKKFLKLKQSLKSYLNNLNTYKSERDYNTNPINVISNSQIQINNSLDIIEN